MTEYTAQCNSGVGDTITATVSGSSVELEAHFSGDYKGEVYLTPDKARTFARGILALADEIDGGEVAEAAPKRAPKVGDKVRVVKDDPIILTGEFVGLTGILQGINPPDSRLPFDVRFDAYHGARHDSWNCTEVELVDEVPAPEPALADWERDLLEGPARSSRAKYVEEAKDLLAGRPAGVDEILRMAMWLAADE